MLEESRRKGIRLILMEEVVVIVALFVLGYFFKEVLIVETLLAPFEIVGTSVVLSKDGSGNMLKRVGRFLLFFVVLDLVMAGALLLVWSRWQFGV